MNEPSLDDVRAYAGKAWRLFSGERNLNATLAWSDDPSVPGGSRMVSARVCGQGAAYALQRFTADYHVVLGAPGDQRPTYDYTDPDRIACVWRKSGVWIELWVSAAQDVQRKPVPAPAVARAQATGPSVLSAPVPAQTAPTAPTRRGLGARLPFPRNRRKETNPA
ncbi:hypothetical protein OIA45_48780 (plasmid) [Streptomyces chartreusis]|uniref:hypothetical protein n=1 Tax=Streptomyces chartreusis TaxID=1969 RepID=UPI0037DD4546|nr:hypothetical protein OIA45_48780 [Streptomyces chartreusis]